MKRLIFSLVLSFVTISFCTGQISFLVEGGANYGKATLSKNDLIKNDNIIGYYLSGTPKFNLTNRLALQSEFQYSLEGYGFNGISGQTKNNFHYIRVIPGVELKIVGPLRIIAGLNYGYLALAKTQDGDPISKGAFEKNDVGLLAGINLTFSNVNIAIKYNYGMNSISETQLTDFEGKNLDLKTKNRFLQVGVGYLLE
ncbi:outer membrane beta-barrel protein [Portibacter lacus]|uniref:Outer membrane protein beta-barrel domain-containing protein n=1 Tax=Portibacter lacus TaxID=1099794 RepID=A0AA37WDB8_9BACT|nr:outer membrane beta-barrel protein [Portibacter lacus]GLR15762.1 hypothetical protein GCM10007940_03770 [Portibacter lacus]